MKQQYRLSGGGAIDRRQPLTFRFNGRRYEGYAGDTLASALLANGVRLVARSFKYHRPRGIMTAGVEEPNALVQIGRGARTLPNLKATEVELFDGLEARSVNAWPSLRFDAGALFGALSRFMPAGFYYKTFFGSPWFWQHVFEPVIRRAAGWGTAPDGEDPDCYDRLHTHCEVLVVGSGPAGIMAAAGAAAGGARVILADEHERLGGSLWRRQLAIDGMAGSDWAVARLDELAGRDNVTLLRRTAVAGYYDGNYLVALERRGHEGTASSPAASRQRLWHIRAQRVVLATGAHERPLVFANNERPGIMLAGALQAYVNCHAVLPGHRIVFFTNNDCAYESVLDCAAAGADIAAVIDSRPDPQGEPVRAARDRGIEVLCGHCVSDTHGAQAVRAVTVRALAHPGDGDRARRRIGCDLLAVSGGYNPAVHLHSQAQGRLIFDTEFACFRPESSGQACVSVGACNGTFSLAASLREGRTAGLQAAAACGYPAAAAPPLPDADAAAGLALVAQWCLPEATAHAGAGRKHFVDLQNDTSVADIRIAVAEGFESVEHMKRYTLAGFGTDQGKISNVNGLAILAGLLDRPIEDVGTTTFRPPYTPVTFGAMGGRDRGELFDPARLTAMHDAHVAAGAIFEDVGQWKRPRYYPRPGEDMHAAVARECAAVRSGVGMLDASTLGKIDIQGADAAEFLNRVYTNAWHKLAVGRIRYGVMCREDGMVFDDGTTARLSDQRYLMTTTTGGAAAVLDHLEEYLQTEWPALNVRLTSVTEQWSTVAVAGPDSRAVLAAIASGLDLDAAAFPFLSWQEALVAGIPARIFRISFSGELQYEINVPWHFGQALWRAVAEAGAPYGMTAYGTETMHVLRAEKGFIIVGQETDGTQTPQDLGLDWLIADGKDFIGRRSLRRPDTARGNRRQLVGLRPRNPARFVPEGSQLAEQELAGSPPPVPAIGYVTSSYWSPALDSHFCLALVDGGRNRHGDIVQAALPEGPVAMTICAPVFFDPDNERRNG